VFRFVSKALLSLVLDKRARDALEVAKAAPTPDPAVPAAKPATKPRSATGPATAPTMTDERRELIRNALAVQRSKQHVFDNLDEDAKAKLLIAAVKALGIPPDQVERELRRPRRNSGPEPKR
jgi:hypothetical protein